MIPGTTLSEFQQALVDAFDADELAMLLRYRLNLRLDRIVKPAALDFVVFQLIKWAEHHGTLVVVDLARAAYLERPLNEQVRRVYEKLGMAPELECQDQGADVAGSPGRVTSSGLEAIVSPLLKSVDIDVWREKIARIEGQVCRVEFDGNPMGTGFLIGPDLVLTNYHVLEAAIAGRQAPGKIGFRFDYKVLSDGTRSEGEVFRLSDGVWCVDSSRYTQAEASNQPELAPPALDELDFAVARLAVPAGAGASQKSGASAGAPPRGWIALPETQPPLEKDMPLLIAQHPDGAPMKLALDTRSIIGLNANGTRVRYATNTEHGSSGSPCFNLDWTLVALHHMGDPAWGAPKYNEGVPIGVIRSRLVDKVEFKSQ